MFKIHEAQKGEAFAIMSEDFGMLAFCGRAPSGAWRIMDANANKDSWYFMSAETPKADVIQAAKKMVADKLHLLAETLRA